MPHGSIFQFAPKGLRAHEARWNFSSEGGGDLNPGLSPDWNMARAQHLGFAFMYLLKENEGSRD